MAKLKMKKYPKKPKASSSAKVKENYIKRCKDIDKENKRREAENKKNERLTEQIRRM